MLAAVYATAQSANPSIPFQASKPAPKTPQPAQPRTKHVVQYGLGDQMFVINAGLFVPLFFQTEQGTVSTTNLTLGGTGSLEFDVFLNNNLATGVNLGGSFAFSPNGSTLFLVPVTAKISWIFHYYPFDFPVFFGAGVNFMELDNTLYVGPIAKPGVAGYWNFNSKWSFGLRAVYWWVPEIYFGTYASQSRFGNFLELSLSALYHF